MTDEAEANVSASEASALALAMNAAKHDDGVAAQVRIFLEEQTRLIRLQAEDLKREDVVRHWSLRIHHATDLLKLGFEIAAALVVLLVAAFLCIALWRAAHDKSLIIEAFNVPAFMADDGLTGQAIASHIQDKLTWMQKHTDTIRQANTFRNNWANDIKVQIPDTGVSVSDLYRYLAVWLGDQTHITGEVWRNGKALSIAVRIGNDAAANISGNDINDLLNKASEQIYLQTQPFGYSVFLSQQSRSVESLNVTRSLALDGPAEERPWAYSRWGIALQTQGDYRGALAMQRRAAELGPNLPHVWGNLAGIEALLGHEEAELHDNERSIELFDSSYARSLAAYAVAAERISDRILIAELSGDFRSAVELAPQLRTAPDFSRSHESVNLFLSADLARDHDLAESRRLDPKDLFEIQEMELLDYSLFDMPPLSSFEREMMLNHWAAARADLLTLQRFAYRNGGSAKFLLPVLIWPYLAEVNAELGDFKEARTLIDKTPLDCSLCIRARGKIDSIEKNWAGAAAWFTQAVKQAPSLPFAYTDWAAMLIAKGDYPAAIEKLAVASQKGPHFADALEMWGEALIAERRSDLALMKFEEANNYAPRWGRLHMKWGEALYWTGNIGAARDQFARATKLDSVAGQASELQKLPANRLAPAIDQ